MEPSTLCDERGHGEALQPGMELVRGSKAQVTHLDDGLHPGLSGRSLGHHQHPDGLDRSVLGLARTGSSTTYGGPCRLHCIESVGLALAATGLPVLAVDFDYLHAFASEEPGEPGAIRAGALDADLGHLAEALEPVEQCLVAGSVGVERLGADEASEWIECCGNVGVEVGVDTTRDPGWSFYDGHGRPYFP